MTEQTKKFDEMSIWDLYETDMSKETEGFWYRVNKKVSVKLARAGGANMSFSKAMEEKTRDHRKRGGAFEGNKVDVELATDLMKQAFAETIILDWKGFTSKAGKTVAYSPKAAYEMMVALPDLFNELRDAAGEIANFRIEEIQEDVGN
jgi:hypothetical protein